MECKPRLKLQATLVSMVNDPLYDLSNLLLTRRVAGIMINVNNIIMRKTLNTVFKYHMHKDSY